MAEATLMSVIHSPIRPAPSSAPATSLLVRVVAPGVQADMVSAAFVNRPHASVRSVLLISYVAVEVVRRRGGSGIGGRQRSFGFVVKHLADDRGGRLLCGSHERDAEVGMFLVVAQHVRGVEQVSVA